MTLFSCSSRLTVPPLVQFHGAGSFFRPSGTFLLFPRIQVGEVFVIQLGQRMRESCCLLGVRITLLFCRCLPLSKETQNFIVVHGAIPRLRYDGPAELRGTQFHLLCISSGCPQCGEYHDGSSCSLSFLFYVPVRQDVIGFCQMPDLGTLPAAAMPAKETAGWTYSGRWLQNPLDLQKFRKLQPRQHMAEFQCCGLAEDTLCAVTTGSDAPVQIPRPLSS